MNAFTIAGEERVGQRQEKPGLSAGNEFLEALEEPMFNLLALFRDGCYICVLVPRAAHRPACYFADEPERIAISPAAVEMAGILVVAEPDHLDRVTAATAPETNPRTDTLERSCSLIDGTWTEVWTKVQLDSAVAAENIREQRNELLAETDWTQLSDSSVASTWTTYRQALRDVPSQEGFPYSVTWPTKPS